MKQMKQWTGSTKPKVGPFEKTNVLDIPLLSMSRGKERRYLSNVRDEKGSTGTSLCLVALGSN